MVQTHYYEADVAALMRRLPYLRIDDRGTGALLTELNNLAARHAEALAQFPDVLIEPLEPLYACHIAVSTLDAALLGDLLFGFGWRGTRIGAWLALLAPQGPFRPLLSHAMPGPLKAQAVLQLALGALGAPLPQDLSAAATAAAGLQETLAKLPRRAQPLRRSMTQVQQAQYEREAEAVRQAYHAGDKALALTLSRQGLLGYYLPSLADWRAAGCPPPPEMSDAAPSTSLTLPPATVVSVPVPEEATPAPAQLAATPVTTETSAATSS